MRTSARRARGLSRRQPPAAPCLWTTRGLAGKPEPPSVASLFASMDYTTAPESADLAHAWLDSHQRQFGFFIDGAWQKPEGRSTAPSARPSTGAALAETLQAEPEDVDAAVAAARRAQPLWAGLSPHARSRHLYSLARHLQKHARLLAVVESLDNGKTVRETRDADVPLAVRHFYSHAGWAQLFESEMAGYEPVGVVGQVIPWNFPLLMLAWKIAPALAMGNTVVLKPAPWTRLSAWLFADICIEAGLPPGVVNIVSGDDDMASYFAGHDGLDKLAFTGSTAVGKALRRQVAGTGRKITLELGGKSPVVVFDSADLDSAVEGLVNGIWYNQGQVCCAGSRLLVQESIHDEFIDKVKRRMQALRVGDSLDKCVDMGPVADPVQYGRIDAYVEQARVEGATVYQSEAEDPGQRFYPPTLVTDVQSSSVVVQEEIFGPVLVAQSFRTPAEAVALANNSRFGLSAGVWTEHIGLALDVALSIKAGTVWVNCHNKFDAAAGFGGVKDSGIGREGGKEGLYAYVRVAGKPSPRVSLTAAEKDAPWGATTMPAIPGAPVAATSSETGGLPAVDRTPKMYIGGSQKRPDGNYSYTVSSADGEALGQVGDGSRKDIRDAVEVAHSAAKGWGKRAAHNRAQILYYIAENLSIRETEFTERLVALSGNRDQAEAEVAASIERLFHWAAYADKFGGTVQETEFRGVTTAVNEPVGVIGITAPNEAPLLGFLSLVAPAVVRGNAVVAVPSQTGALAVTDLYQILDTSDLPGGVINIVTGERDVLTKTLAEHQDVDAVWYHGTKVGCYHVERLAADNMKRVFCNYGQEVDYIRLGALSSDELLREASAIKQLWVPVAGE